MIKNYLAVFEVLNPLSLLVVEAETMVLTVRHQNVPNVVNSYSGRIVELPVSRSGRPKSSDGLEFFWVENVDFI